MTNGGGPGRGTPLLLFPFTPISPAESPAHLLGVGSTGLAGAEPCPVHRGPVMGGRGARRKSPSPSVTPTLPVPGGAPLLRPRSAPGPPSRTSFRGPWARDYLRRRQLLAGALRDKSRLGNKSGSDDGPVGVYRVSSHLLRRLCFREHPSTTTQNKPKPKKHGFGHFARSGSEFELEDHRGSWGDRSARVLPTSFSHSGPVNLRWAGVAGAPSTRGLSSPLVPLLALSLSREGRVPHRRVKVQFLLL